VGKPSLNAAQPYAKAEGRVFLLVPAYPGCPGTKAVKRLLLWWWWWWCSPAITRLQSTKLLITTSDIISLWNVTRGQSDLMKVASNLPLLAVEGQVTM